MPIVRDEDGKRRYNNLSITHIRDKRLSLKAIGLMSVMLTLPDTWKFSVEGLATLTADEIDSVRNGLLELERFGYITRQRVRDKGKLKDTVYTLYESPMRDFPTLEKPILEKPILEKPILEKPILEKPTLENQPQNNNISNNQINEEINKGKKEIKKKETSENFSDFLSDEMRICLRRYIEMRKDSGTRMTEKQIETVVKKCYELEPDSDERRCRVLNQATEHGWKFVYPLNEEKKDEKKNRYENAMSEIERWINDGE